jgi:hypothetical protein
MPPNLIFLHLILIMFTSSINYMQISWKVVGLERGPLKLVSTTEKLLGRKSRGSGLENREYGRRDPSHWPRGTLYPQKLAVTSPTCGSRSVGIVRSWTQTMEFFFVVGLEQGPLRLESTTEELLGRKSSGSGLESREYGRRDPSQWPRGTLNSQELALTSHTDGGRSFDIAHSRAQTTDFVLFLFSNISYKAPHYLILFQPPIFPSILDPDAALCTLPSNILSLMFYASLMSRSLSFRDKTRYIDTLNPYRCRFF